jgi:hypothetical protein
MILGEFHLTATQNSQYDCIRGHSWRSDCKVIDVLCRGVFMFRLISGSYCILLSLTAHVKDMYSQMSTCISQYRGGKQTFASVSVFHVSAVRLHVVFKQQPQPRFSLSS